MTTPVVDDHKEYRSSHFSRSDGPRIWKMPGEPSKAAPCKSYEPFHRRTNISTQINSVSHARENPFRAQVEFTQPGVTRAGRVVGIAHDRPMRHDLQLEDGAIVSNIWEPAIGSLIALP